MYAKIAKYGQQAQTQQGQICGQISIEVLPQGNLSHHINLDVQEVGSLSKHPEPMVLLSIDSNKHISCSLSELVKLIQLAVVKPEVIGQHITESPKYPAIGANFDEPFDSNIIEIESMDQMKQGVYYVGESGLDFIVFCFDKFIGTDCELISTNCSYDSNPDQEENHYQNGLIFNNEWFKVYRLATKKEISKYFAKK